MTITPILFDYGFSPYSQKVHLFCAAAGIKLLSCEQPIVLPRPTLEKLEITYRRIPVLAIGKDVFVDTSLIIDVLQGAYSSSSSLVTAEAKAFEIFGDSLFRDVLRAAPPGRLEPNFVKDRKDIFPILSDPNYATFRTSALADYRASLTIVEREFLGHGKPFMNGDEISLSDVNIAWVIRWSLEAFGVKDEPAFQPEHFPKLFAWLARLPTKDTEKLSQEKAIELVSNGTYAVKESSEVANDPLGIPIGEQVTVETTDSEPGSHPQYGKLISLKIDTVTIELKNGLRMHFPRRGIVVKKANH